MATSCSKAILTLSHLRINGSNRLYRQHPAGIACPAPVSQPLVIAGHDDTLQYDDYFQSVPDLRSTGIGIGFWSQADNTVIRDSKIHDVGQCQAYDHLIYLSHGTTSRSTTTGSMTMPTAAASSSTPPPPTPACSTTSSTTSARASWSVMKAAAVPTGNRIYDNIVLDALGLPTEHIPAGDP